MGNRVKECVDRCHDVELGELVRSAAVAALAAGQIIRKLYDQPHQVRLKGEIDLVTEADVASEQIILEILRRSHPGVDILAEEDSHGITRRLDGPAWVIDPLDGTTNFAHGFPWFAVSIGYVENCLPVAGVIYHPMLDELFCAASGAGAWLNGLPVQVSRTTGLASSLTATGFPYSIRAESTQVMAALEAVVTRCQGVRRAGAAALDLAYVACGRLDGFWEIGLKPWDTAAGSILLIEAGGRLSDFSGNPFSSFFPEVIASNTLIHDELVALLAPYHR